MSGSTFTVTNPGALDEAVDPLVRTATEALRSTVAASTPTQTGRLAASWQVRRVAMGRYALGSDVPYAKFVEFGTRKMRAAAMLGRAIAGARS